MSKSLENQSTLVTGGSTGIGRAVARQLAESGAQVVITGRHEETLRESASQHSNISFVVADVAEPGDVARTIEEVRRRHSGLDVLVNNAGIARVVPLSDADPEHAREIFGVNVLGLIRRDRSSTSPRWLPSDHTRNSLSIPQARPQSSRSPARGLGSSAQRAFASMQ